MRPVYYYTPPLAPRRFLQGAAARIAKYRRVLEVPRAPPAPPPTEASSSILSCWQRRAPNDLMHQNSSPEAIRGSLSSLRERTLQVSCQKGGLGFDFPRQEFPPKVGATFGAAFVLCQICVSGNAHFCYFLLFCGYSGTPGKTLDRKSVV